MTDALLDPAIDPGIDTGVDAAGIKALLPHRHPMLLVDRVLTAQPGERLVAVKAVTVNEPWFAGTDDFTYPQALLVESWGQAAGVLAVMSDRGRDVPSDRVMLFGSVSEAEFRQPVRPGDVVEHEVRMVRDLGETMIFEGRSTVRGELVLAVTRMVMAFRPAGQLAAASAGVTG